MHTARHESAASLMSRPYYDHEPAYRRIHAANGKGWDDLTSAGTAGSDSYDALDGFLASAWRPAAHATSRAIDLGCGGGQGSLRLARCGFRTTGVDFSPTAIDLAKRNSAKAGIDVAFHVADCLDMRGFARASFDLAVDNHTLHCLLGGDRARFLQQAAHLLRPGGLLFSETMSCEGRPDFAGLGVDPVTRTNAAGNRYWVGRDELLGEFESAGFEVLRVDARSQPDRPDPGHTLVTIVQRM